MNDPVDMLHMRRALELAARGEGHVEPNPMVGCVITQGDEVVGEGWHRRYGQAHAEVDALHGFKQKAAGATLYVTLEPCCHFGKTPPCTQAIIAAGVRRVVVAQQDPFPEVSGRGIAELRKAGILVDVGCQEPEAQQLNAPYRKLLRTGRPWVIAKWAMTLDGKIASRTGNSKWISGDASRAIVHQQRGRVDAVVVGLGTALADDPLLTARPPGPRVAARIVLDTRAELPLSSRLVQSASEVPLLVAVGTEAPFERRQALVDCGCEVLACEGNTSRERLLALLDELGRRRMTNLLVEGGSRVLGDFFDLDQIDEAHVFIAPKIIGGGAAPSAIAGAGRDLMASALELTTATWRQLGGDLYVHGRVRRHDWQP